MTSLRLSLLMALLMALTGCDPRRKQDVPPLPEGFVEREQFIAIHAQLQLLEAARVAWIR